MNPIVEQVTRTIIERSKATRAAYLARIEAAQGKGRQREHLACGNLAHALAACSSADKDTLAAGTRVNIGIVTAYNDMLSAHQPYHDYPEQLKNEIMRAGAVAQVAGGVPAMCDGVTQGQDGMELSLWSRDVIALSTAVALSHAMFDGMLLLGICDKIVPGLLIGALSFGHLPALFVPSGPMPSGISNKEKQKVRQLYAEGKANKAQLLESELKSYHSPGTCTFFGTANSNQLLLELMGLQLPGSSFVNPGTPLRIALTKAAARHIVNLAVRSEDQRPLGHVVDEKAIVNAMVGLVATGGSTNHTIHLVAVARAAGILINWDDFAALSKATPLMARIYPNGEADVNQFQQAGGMAVLTHSLLEAGLVHADVLTAAPAAGLSQYQQAPVLVGEGVQWQTSAAGSTDTGVLRDGKAPFAPSGGIHLMSGNLGRGIIKISAVKPEHCVIEAEAVVFEEQQQLIDAFKAGALDRDFVAVLRYQGPRANGMPELHQLTPTLSVLLDRGFKVALVTDGRMSGASGKVPAVLHLWPEAASGGPLALVQNGDRIRVDATSGTLELLVAAAELKKRIPASSGSGSHAHGCGRELFANFRAVVGSAEEGACSLM
ncbi:MAG TPA: phosphogluconate dehydratase [Candidatus Acidoferrum sp.]|nr:phosphogluconate dehydratase [Candidatus Acidoferrum sp.]